MFQKLGRKPEHTKLRARLVEGDREKIDGPERTVDAI